MNKERWVFTDVDLLNPHSCQRGDKFFATCPVDEDDDPEEQLRWWRERGIVVYRNGYVSNRYADGSIGVSDEERELADSVESLYKCGGEQFTPNGNNLDGDTWRNVIVSDDGTFVSFDEGEE